MFKICSTSRKNNRAIVLSWMNTEYLDKDEVSRVDENVCWGKCENGNCLNGGGLGLDLYGDLNRFVGSETVNDLAYGCNCKGLEKYGPFCDWNEPEENNRDFCGSGRYNIKNFLSACECRNKTTNEAVPYYGWYCDIHNRLLCDKSKTSFYHGKFYDVSSMNTDKVADCCSNVCKECDEIIKNCKECKQDAGNNCKSFTENKLEIQHF